MIDRSIPISTASSAWLDKNIDGGLGNVWISLTADHGVAPFPPPQRNLA